MSLAELEAALTQFSASVDSGGGSIAQEWSSTRAVIDAYKSRMQTLVGELECT